MRNLSITLILLSSLYSFAFSQVNLDYGLLAYYPFNGNANDASGNNNHGIVSGATLTADRLGKADAAYHFNGVDDFIDLSNSYGIKPDLPVTIAAWIYYEQDGGIFHNNSNTALYYGVWLNIQANGKLSTGFGDGDPIGSQSRRSFITTDTVSQHTWHHVAAIIRGATDMELYIDGVSMQGIYTGSGGPLAYSQDPAIIGRQYISDPFYYGGNIDELYFYNRELSEEEIQFLYQHNDIISMSVDSLKAFKGDTLQIPVNVQFPPDSLFSSAEISIGGYIGKLDFIDITTENSVTGDAGWTFQVNETDSLNISWFAGSENISGEGVLFWLKVAIPDSVQGFIPIKIESALFNTGDFIVETQPGGVQIFPFIYGDVDLNNQVQAFDASLILKHLVSLVKLDTFQLSNANVSQTAGVSALDATLILQYGVGLINFLPYDTSLGLPLASGDIGMDNKSAQNGFQLEVPLYLSNNHGILSFEGKILYDPDYLNITDIVWSEIFNDFDIETNKQDGEIIFAGAGTNSSEETGVIANLYFTVQENTNVESTSIVLKELRWNEGKKQEDVANSVISIVTGIKDKSNISITEYELCQNYPNPFNPSTKIKYAIPTSDDVQIKVYSTNGQVVWSYLKSHVNAGFHEVQFNAQNLSSGIYFYSIQAGNFNDVKKMILIK